MVYSYVRVSTDEQKTESQKNLISRYCVDKKMIIDKWIEIEISSKKSTRERRIEELIQKIEYGDVVIVSELSRLGRSIKEVLYIIERIVKEKKCRMIIPKQNLDIDPNNTNDMANKILITIFSMLAELERDFISERTKEGLNALKNRGIKLGKPVGTIQNSMYDKDRERIFHLYKLGVPINTIINTHLKYGKFLSLKNYIMKRYKVDATEK
jgi:DNA invertase Pin-like site-specific DNA recombinase